MLASGEIHKDSLVRKASRMEIRGRARRGVSPFWSGWEVTMSGFGRGEVVMRRGSGVWWNARCCVNVAARRLLEEQIAVVVVPERGEKNDAKWHMPHRLVLSPWKKLLLCSLKQWTSYSQAVHTDLFLEVVDGLFAKGSYYSTKWWTNSNVIIRWLCEFCILI